MKPRLLDLYCGAGGMTEPTVEQIRNAYLNALCGGHRRVSIEQYISHVGRLLTELDASRKAEEEASPSVPGSAPEEESA